MPHGKISKGLYESIDHLAHFAPFFFGNVIKNIRI